MAVAKGEDGKLHYTNNNKWESYGHWYDEGPGSEKFKREIFREPKRPYFHPFTTEDSKKKIENWPEWKRKAAESAIRSSKNYDEESKMLRAIYGDPADKKELKKLRKKEYITDEDLEIDI